MGKLFREKFVKPTALILAGCLLFQGVECNAANASERENETTLYEDGFETNQGSWEAKDGAVLSVTEEKSHNGSKCLKISERPATYAGAKLVIGDKLKNNHLLKISAYVRYDEGPDEKKIQLTLSRKGNYSTMGSVVLKKGEWGELTGSGILSDNLDLSDASLYFETPWTADPAKEQDLMDIYVDDVKISLCSFCDTSVYPSLKTLYKDEFLIGSAVTDRILDTTSYSNLVQQQFNSLTMENEMKPDYILDKEESLKDLTAHKENAALKFDSYKAGLEYAKKHGIKMRGHTLVWHSQTPDWFFYENYDTSGSLAGRDLMLRRMENYIKEVIQWTETNYPGVIYAWDVANEAVADPWGDGADHPMRQEGSFWYQTIGEDFVQKAFEYARKYTNAYAGDRQIKLFYNDYNEYYSVKRDRIVDLLKPVKEAGNIDGVGMQSHIDTRQPLYGDNGYMTAVRKFTDELGLELHVTELDIGIAKATETETAHTEEYQGEYYQKFMEALLKEKKDGANITCVTFWGFCDNLSWRPDENCLFLKEDLSRKSAFDGVVKAIGNTGAVIDMINAIGTVTAEEACGTKIAEAKAAYESLTDAQKELVTNYETLMTAETTYEELKKEQIKNEEINNTPPLSVKKSIENANAAEISTQFYTGNEIKPAVTISYEGNKLTDGKDYTVSYENNIIIGTAAVTIHGKGDYTGSKTISFRISVKKDAIYTVGNYKYKISNADVSGKGTVTVTGVNDSNKKNIKSIKIADTVDIGGADFKVTAIGNAAFKKCKKLTNAVIGKNIKIIEKNAFFKCPKLKKITIKSTKLKSVGKNALKGIHAKAKIKVPAKKLKAYKKLLKGKGQKNSCTIRR